MPDIYGWRSRDGKASLIETMELNRDDRQRLLNESWGGLVGRIRLLSESEAAFANQEKRRLIAALGDRVQQSYGGSKLHLGELSPGCRSCGDGNWSCLFVTRQCQGSCFYCPAFKSPADMAPYADGMEFSRFDDYLRYLGTIGINGVAFSGGDPLLVPDRVIEYIRLIRQTFGKAIYLWVYTNGLTATKELLGALGQAGLDEIRFNTGAVGYSLDQVALAMGIIDRVTVEIACVPEDLPILRRSLLDMAAMGIHHLNLHQIILSSANLASLEDRGYHFTRSPTPSVVESELAVLELLLFALEEGIGLPINHCNTAYKGRWQPRGTFKRINRRILAGHESETELGYIRRLWVETDPVDGRSLVEKVASLDEDGQFHQWDQGRERLDLHPRLLGQVGPWGGSVRLQYFGSGLSRDVILPLERRSISIGPTGEITAVIAPVSEVITPDASGLAFLEQIGAGRPAGGGSARIPYELAKHECMGQGLPDYD